jgi:hypothetical protein
MADEIKLYKHFVEQIEKIGKVKRAWFTTFNLDISFFEKYILSALMGKGYDELKTPYDYESLSANLANEKESLDGEKMEVKVFYDYRTLKVEGKPKQTSVHLHPVNIATIRDLKTSRFKDGVFHPKVSIIESYEGKYYLMVSSANLTLGGWARNRECFFFEEIKNTKIGKNIGKFFSGIVSSIAEFKDNDLINKLNTGRFGTDEQKWSFLSSFSSNRFLDCLNYTKGPLPLKVWSPYFANDLSDLITEFQEDYFESIEIIPAKNENQKIRITEEIYKKCESANNVIFKQDNLPKAALESFVHAKVWLTPKTLAIGSWNMTWSGINESKKGNNNVEAGIIYNLTPKEYQQVLEGNPVTNLKSHDFYNEEELNEEKQNLLDEYTVSVDIVLDWDKQIIKLVNPTYSGLIKDIGEDTFIELPGFGLKKINFLESSNNFASYSKLFLTDRFFEITNKKSKTLYKGYIREIGLVSRPVNSFENIDDFLKGWVTEKPEEKTELFGLAYDPGDEDGISSQTKAILYGNDQNSWFTSFHAFECIINRINSTKSLYAVDRRIELKRIGRVLPGSLNELKIHLEKLLELYKTDKTNFKKSPIYLWFLIEKANFVFGYFNELIILFDEQISPIRNLKFEEVIDQSKLNKLELEGLDKWKRFILTQIKKTEV